MKKIIFSVIFTAVAVCVQAQNLTWEIKVYRERTREYIPITQIIRGVNDETFRVDITAGSDCFCYVVCYDSERQVSVLYNAPMKGGIENHIVNLEIDGAGTDTLYVIMSLKRQARLESLIQTYNANPNSQQNANNLYREVVRLQNEASGLGEPANNFIASGGTSRGASEEFATRFTNKDMYVRAITIRH
jgi:hypothetical protein